TGAEIAAEITEMARETLLPRYPHLTREDISIVILEGGDRIVPTARPKHSAYIHRYLERHGVRIELKAAAKRVEEKRVTVADGRPFDGFTILWTAGVCPPDFVKELPFQHIRDGRVRVDDHLRALLPDGAPLENFYVLGDCAASLKKD